MSPSTSESCPCGLGQPYDQCCGRLHAGQGAAATAEALMRSRYSAFAVRDEAYLLRTWHSRTRVRRIAFDTEQRWTGLDILGTTDGGMLHPSGTVEFRAHFNRRGVLGSQHEVSRFIREDGRWVYLGELDG
ncbi:MAG TPA: YchJ family metal-binding protein [Kineosporiaceae bacterium]|nr:YchJ family metal-binding protein [Kineosporiaceae bacterium]